MISKGWDDKGIDIWIKSWMLFSLNTWQWGFTSGGRCIEVLRLKEGIDKDVDESDWEFELEWVGEV